MQLSGKVAVITGAGSGIGKALALRLVAEGTHVALVDINADYLAEVYDTIDKQGGVATTHVVDIACRDSVATLVEDVIRDHSQVDVLINNAGVSLARMSMQEISWEQWEWMMNVNFWGTLHCTKLFFPYLRTRPEAHIANVSSVFSLGGVARRSAYCAAKFAVRGMTEALNQEVKGTPIRVSSVLPGGVATKIVQHCQGWQNHKVQAVLAERHRQKAYTSPEQAAAVIVRGIKKKKKRILIGLDAYFMNFIVSYLRPCMDWGMERLILGPEERRMKQLRTAKGNEKSRPSHSTVH